MSNLSELLPTGGGQNAVDFVASGTLSSGQAVSLKADGTVEAVSGSVVSGSLGSLTQFNSSNSVYVASAYHADQNKIVVAYGDGGNVDYGTACVGTISGTSITFGTPVVFLSAEALWISAAYDSSTNKIVISYRDGGNSSYGTAIVGTVSGSSISFGTAAVFESAATTYIATTYDSANNKIVIAYSDGGNSSYGTAIVGTVAGTSISFGTAVVFESASSPYIATTFDSTSGKILIAYQDQGNTNYGTAIVGTVSGTAISFGTAVVFESANTSYIATTFDSTSGKVLIAYRDSGNSQYGTAIVGTVSGTSISFGTAVVFASAITINITASHSPLANVTNFAYTDNGNAGLATYITGTVSGTTISFDTEASLEPSNGDYFSSASIGSGKVFFGYRSGTTGEGIVLQNVYTATNSADFIGITAEAISSAATGAVNVYGGINSVQTGLTIASDYYVQYDGTLSTASASPAIKVGQAISATTINMKDLT
tara:strand:- start:954 stop:2405 length:1452 start_codon:yes stop_codon:yes gene_type:complete